MRGSGAYFTAICSPYCLLYLSPFPSLTTSLDPLQSSVLDHTDVILRAPAFHPYGSQQYPSRAAPKLVYSGAPTAAGSSQGVLSAAGWHQILGSGWGGGGGAFNMLAELEAYRHKRDEAAQQNEAPVAGSVEGQSVPVKIETLVGKVVQLKLCNRTGGNSPGKQQTGHFSSYHFLCQTIIWNHEGL
ncbi:hypothetical protein EMCRGX_G007460 [Ephydatia muelleri]